MAEECLLPLASKFAYKVAYKPSLRKLLYEDTGSEVYFVNSLEPNNLRGVSLNYAWGVGYNDWQNKDETVTNIHLSLRLGSQTPQENFLLTV